MELSAIRNFSIVAHIDHGKSTLADRFLERTGAITPREFREQLLDDMDLERERGITIKARAVRLFHEVGGKKYMLNLIDTPGHVDFTYEVSRSLRACEGAVLLVDASQGVEAQTISNIYLCMENDLDMLPVMNKTDLKTARPDEVGKEISSVLGVEEADILSVSAKTGEGVDHLLEEIVRRVPSPKGNPDADLQAFVFDAVFDEYKGIVVYVRVINGMLARGQRIEMVGTKRTYDVVELGVFAPKPTQIDSLGAGQVGYFTAAIKQLADVHIGDTVRWKNTSVKPLHGYTEPLPMVFCGLYPAIATEFDSLRKALHKLALNDSSFTYQAEKSEALGFGFRCGFLGLLHMEISQERLERESGIEVIQTAPSVSYEVLLKNETTQIVRNASELPDPTHIEETREPISEVSMIIPADSIGAMMKLCEDRRGSYVSTQYLSQTRVVLTYRMPMAEIMYDFFDKLKSATKGYGTMDYHFTGYQAADLVKLDILVAEKRVDALSTIVHSTEADRRGRQLIRTLQKKIPRHLFQIPLQAAIGGRIIARENIRPLAKNVTAKCYGGDITRKRKLLERQKEGKKRMKQVGRVSIPQEAFLAALKRS
jgi:GTP-binding protein LepA